MTFSELSKSELEKTYAIVTAKLAAAAKDDQPCYNASFEFSQLDFFTKDNIEVVEGALKSGMDLETAKYPALVHVKPTESGMPEITQLCQGFKDINNWLFTIQQPPAKVVPPPVS